MTGAPADADRVYLLRPSVPPASVRAPAIWFAVLAAGVSAIALVDPTAAAVVAFFGVGLLVAALHPGLVAPYLVLATPLGYWHPQIAGVQMPVLEMAALGAALGCVPRAVAGGGSGDRLTGADIAFAALVGGVVLSGAGSPPRSAWAHNVVFWSSLAVVFWATHRAMHRRCFRTTFVFGIGVAAFAEAVVAIVQYIQGSSGRFSRLGGAIVYPQPQGTLGNPNALAPYLVVGLLLLAGAALAEPPRRRNAIFAVATVVGIGSLVPFSRGGWISLAAGLLVWSGAQRRARRLLATIAILGSLLGAALVFGGAFGARLSSLVSRHFSDLYGFRLTLADRAAHIVAHHPLTGTGVFREFGTYAGRPSLATHPHDLLLGVAVFFGIPAALAFLALLVLAVRGALRAVTSGSATLRAEGAGAIAVLAVYVVDGFLEYPFWNDSLTVLAVAVLAYSVALGESSRGDPRTAVPATADEPSRRERLQ